MIIRCDNCSVSLQLDEGKIPSGNFTVRCPRCQNLIRVQPGAKNRNVDQLKENAPAPAVAGGTDDFSTKESEFQINTALRALLSALQTENKVIDSDDDKGEKAAPRSFVSRRESATLLRKRWVEAG